MPSRKLFFNGKIFTSAADDGRLETLMLIEDDRVICVGEEASVRARSQEVSSAASVPVSI